MNWKLAKRMDHLKASEIREILKVTENLEIISFAGGLPAPELFPVKEIGQAAQLTLEQYGAQALQYTTTEGFLPLRKWIAERMNQRLQTCFGPDHILITHGSQQSLDLSGKVFLDEGDVVLCECPTYLAAISAFRAYGCTFIEVPTDDEGMLPEALEQILSTTPRAKLIYAIPDFQNPTGRTWSLERRKALAALSEKYQVPVLEDNPYGELRYEGAFYPSIKAFDQAGSILCCGTFSKIFCPGYRIGWIAGDQEMIRKFVLVKQGTDLQCNTLAQMEIYTYLQQYDIDAHIAKIQTVYKRRRDLTIQLMEECFPSNVQFTRPQGGLFCWIVLPEGTSARELLTKCLAQKVAFVPGDSFYPNTGRENTFRINFSNMPEERIQQGIQILGRVLCQELGEVK